MSPASWRRPRTPVWALAGKVALSLGLLGYLLGRLPLDQFLGTLTSARPGWLAAAWAVMLGSNLLGSYQWGRLLRVVEIRIPFWKVCAYYHVGLFFNNFLPANIGGDISRVVDSSRYGPTRAAAFSAVLMDRLIGTVALAGIAVATALPVLDRFHLTLIYLVLVGFFGVSVTLLWALFRPALLPSCERVLRRVGLSRLGPHLEDLAVRLAGYREQPRLLVRMLAVAGLVQVSRIAVHVLVARALGVRLPIVYFFLFVPMLAVIVSLPISLNGIGVREGAGIVLFGLVGVDRAHAFSLQFVTYLVAMVVSLLGGLVYLVRIPRRRAESRNQRRS